MDHRLGPVLGDRKADQIAFLDKTLNDDQPDHVKRGVIVALALRLRANRLLRDLHNHCRRLPQTGSRQTV
jgi:hypothetical protein